MELSAEKKYQTIINDILERIKNNDFSYTEPICTEKEIIENYNVSRTTAVRAVSELVQQGVLYRKRGVGSFVTQKGLDSLYSSSTIEIASNNFAFLAPFGDIATNGLFDTIKVVNDSLSDTDYCMSIYISQKSIVSERRIMEQLLNQNISGLIFYPLLNNYHMDLLNTLVLNKKLVILIDKSTDCPYIHNVISDNFDGGRQLAEYLLSLGHRNIAFFSYTSIGKTTSVRDRFGGVFSTLRESGISLNPDFVMNQMSTSVRDTLYTDKNPELLAAVQATYQNGVTAIIVENDKFAYNIYRACQHIGLRVPEDISICGFDDTEWSLKGDVGITTIHQDFSGIGQKISEIIKDFTTTPNIPIQRVLVPVRLIQRGSCDKPRM